MLISGFVLLLLLLLMSRVFSFAYACAYAYALVRIGYNTNITPDHRASSVQLDDHIHTRDGNKRIQLKAVFVVYHHFLHSLYTFDIYVIHVSDQSLHLKNRKCQYLIYTGMQFVFVFNETFRSIVCSPEKLRCRAILNV